MKTMKFEAVSGCTVVVISTETPDPDEWDAFVRFQDAQARAAQQSSWRVLVVSAGGAPSSDERLKVNEMVAAYRDRTKIAVVVASQAARGVVTALSWFNPIYKAFLPTQLDQAFAYLELDGVKAAEARRVADKLSLSLRLPALPR